MTIICPSFVSLAIICRSAMIICFSHKPFFVFPTIIRPLFITFGHYLLEFHIRNFTTRFICFWAIVCCIFNHYSPIVSNFWSLFVGIQPSFACQYIVLLFLNIFLFQSCNINKHKYIARKWGFFPLERWSKCTAELNGLGLISLVCERSGKELQMIL